MKYYAVGDTGGHRKQLEAGLESIGVDVDNFTIPEGVTIIHMGDLIHKGPASRSLLTLVRDLQDRNPGRWIQLLGNHEAQHLIGGVMFWNCESCVEPDTDDLIQSMWNENRIVAAHSLKGLSNANMTLSARDCWIPTCRDWLLTHGGLSPRWADTLHCDLADVDSVAKAINGLSPRRLSIAGSRLGNPGSLASPVWASAPDEVIPQWEGRMPFNQLAGHTYPFDWERELWFGGPRRAAHMRKLSKLNPDLRTVITQAGRETVFVSVDPGFEKRQPTILAQPLVLIGED